MSTTTKLPVTDQIDSALDEITQAQAVALSLPGGVERCLRLADLAEVEAAWWEELSERTHTRVHWRAALTAREHALATAHQWRIRAAAQLARDDTRLTESELP